jgi:hypothetical protein
MRLVNMCLLRGRLLLLSAGLLACEVTPVARSIRVAVHDDEGRAMVGIPVEIDGISTIKTGSDGSARISLAASGPPRARIGVSCAPGYRELPPRHIPRAVLGSTAKLDLAFSCRPRQRKLALVVNAPGAQGLLLRADGAPVGRIEADGTLHATVMREPESDLRLMIETGERPVMPRNPTRELRVADHDELVVFDQPLTALPLRGRRKRVAPAHTASTPVLPYEIRGNGS